MWTIVRAFWRLLGACTADLSYDRRQRVYSAVLMATCVHNLYAGPDVACGGPDRKCADATTAVMYDRAVAVTTLLSRAAIVCTGERHVRRYARVVASMDALTATATATASGPGLGTAENGGREERAFAAVVVSACLVAVVSTSVARLCHLYWDNGRLDVPRLVYHAFICAQNLSMCCVETQFACHCYAVYARFRDVNDGLGELRRRAGHSAGLPTGRPSPCDLSARCCGRYGGSGGRSGRRPRPVADAAELLRVRHWMARQAADALNALFGVQMGLAVFLLWAMALLDVYYELYKRDPFDEVWIYCWLLQYALRLFVIITVPHYTTKQALQSRSLITDTNNEILDKSTKEELQLFINQVNCSPAEFNAYDFCTLNMQVIKSVMAAGATYLVVLVQFHNLNN